MCKLNLESVILNLSKPYQKEIELLLSVPSINNIFTAIGILSEIGADMNVFPSAKHLCSWAGLTPTNNESAGKKKSVRISREITPEQAVYIAQRQGYKVMAV